MSFTYVNFTNILLSVSMAAILMTSPSRGFPSYKDLIPNANKVQHPCLPFLRWPGVGHTNSLGGGPRNPFGKDFALAGYQWTSGLCNADSDGDGVSNGQELGDPDCVWSRGSSPSRTSRITHPGYKPFDIDTNPSTLWVVSVRPDSCLCLETDDNWTVLDKDANQGGSSNEEWRRLVRANQD